MVTRATVNQGWVFRPLPDVTTLEAACLAFFFAAYTHHHERGFHEFGFDWLISYAGETVLRHFE